MLLAVLAGLVVLGALVWLGFALVRTFKHVAAVGRDVAAAGDRIAQANAGLQAAQTRYGAGPDPFGDFAER